MTRTDPRFSSFSGYAPTVEYAPDTRTSIPRWLPNAISVVRIALVPLWLALAFEARVSSLADHVPSRRPLVVILLLLGASDLVDGFLARRFGLATNVGAVIDAVADKLAQIAIVTFLALFGTPSIGELPRSLLAVLIARDVVLAIGWTTIRLARGGVRAEHRWHGKLASAALFALLVLCLGGLPRGAVDAASAAIALFVAGSTLDYVRFGIAQLRDPAVDDARPPT